LTSKAKQLQKEKKFVFEFKQNRNGRDFENTNPGEYWEQRSSGAYSLIYYKMVASK
jgi:hypothetical protein